MADIISSGNFNYKIYADGVRRRTRLPLTEKECHNPGVNILAVIRKLFIGMDLARVGLPIACYNAISYVQREVCAVQYADILRKASVLDDPLARMEYVVAFAIASLSDSVCKSHNMQSHCQILGETFEFFRPDLGFRMVAEAVTYSPPGVACHAESVDLHGVPDGVYQISVSSYVEKATFHGRSVEVMFRKCWIIELPQREEIYVISSMRKNCSAVISNFLKGLDRTKLRLDGQIEISCHSTSKDRKKGQPLEGMLTFHPPINGLDWFGGWKQENNPSYSDGYIKDVTSGQHLISFYGNYFKEYYSVSTAVWKNCGGWQNIWNSLSKNSENPFDFNIPGQKLLWRKPSVAEPLQGYFKMNELHMQLGELTPELIASLPPTDSRARKDLRLFEQGLLGKAEEEKNLAEENELLNRKIRIAACCDDRDPWRPSWFSLTTSPYHPDHEIWLFNGQYWKRDWSECPKIAGFYSKKDLLNHYHSDYKQ